MCYLTKGCTRRSEPKAWSPHFLLAFSLAIQRLQVHPWKAQCTCGKRTPVFKSLSFTPTGKVGCRRMHCSARVSAAFSHNSNLYFLNRCGKHVILSPLECNCDSGDHKTLSSLPSTFTDSGTFANGCDSAETVKPGPVLCCESINEDRKASASDNEFLF